MTGTYHKDIGFPPTVSMLVGRHFDFTFSGHALHACLNDRYGRFTPPPELTVQLEQIVEIALFKGVIHKVVVRIPHDENFDIVVVFIPEPRGVGFVKTCWLNHKKDDHSTLDKSKYSTYVVP
jgi:hypothetical protein